MASILKHLNRRQLETELGIRGLDNGGETAALRNRLNETVGKNPNEFWSVPATHVDGQNEFEEVFEMWTGLRCQIEMGGSAKSGYAESQVEYLTKRLKRAAAGAPPHEGNLMRLATVIKNWWCESRDLEDDVELAKCLDKMVPESSTKHVANPRKNSGENLHMQTPRGSNYGNDVTQSSFHSALQSSFTSTESPSFQSILPSIEYSPGMETSWNGPLRKRRQSIVAFNADAVETESTDGNKEHEDGSNMHVPKIPIPRNRSISRETRTTSPDQAHAATQSLKRNRETSRTFPRSILAQPQRENGERMLLTSSISPNFTERGTNWWQSNANAVPRGDMNTRQAQPVNAQHANWSLGNTNHLNVPENEFYTTRIDGRRTIPVAKWGIKKFNGNESEWATFLSETHHFALAERTSKDELFRSRIHLFTGPALNWVLSTPLQDWNHLVTEVSRFVLGNSTERQRIRKIEEMRQKEENCAMFISRMELQFNSLQNHLVDEDKVDIIIGGLKPQIRTAIAGNTGIRTIQDLREATQQVERRMPKSQEVSEVGPEVEKPIANTEENEVSVAYHNRNSRSTNTLGRSHSARTPSRSLSRPKYNDQGQGGGNIFCYICGQKGHISVGCRNPPAKIQCYGCGKEGTMKKNCSTCSGNERGSQ